MPTIAPRLTRLDDQPGEPMDAPGCKGVQLAVLIGREHGAPSFSMRRVDIEAGGFSPRHCHDYEHEVLVLEGSGTVLLSGEEKPIRPGDVILVPPDEEHQFRAAADAPLRFICLVPGTRSCGETTPGS